MKRLLPLVICAAALGGCMEYSTGDRIGTVVKFSKKGFFCKTWEGEMVMGGMKRQTNMSSDGKSTTSSMVANVFQFTVEDERMIPAVMAALESGEPLHVAYREELVTFCRSDSGSYFLTAIKGEKVSSRNSDQSVPSGQ